MAEQGRERERKHWIRKSRDQVRIACAKLVIPGCALQEVFLSSHHGMRGFLLGAAGDDRAGFLPRPRPLASRRLASVEYTRGEI